MTSLREAAGTAAAIRRVDGLAPDAERQWGKMSCAQMLAHCQKPFELALDELHIKRALIGRILGGWAKKKFVTSDTPFSHDSPTDPRFRITDDRDFEREKAGLLGLIERFGNEGVLTRAPHPFFGDMSHADWDRLLSKHLDHHLRQFGA